MANLSIRPAGESCGVSESAYRYKSNNDVDNQRIADWLLRLTTTHKRWGFGLCFLYLRIVKHFGWNRNRVYRIYGEFALYLRIKPRWGIKRDRPEPRRETTQHRYLALRYFWLLSLTSFLDRIMGSKRSLLAFGKRVPLL